MQPKKVLLAEDDKDDQNLFYDFLHERKDIVIMPAVENGVELVDFLNKIANKEHFPDLIILDQNMPKRNGLQTLKLLKENDSYANIPIMVYSTYTDQQLIKMSLELGASAVMSKPLTKEGYDEMLDAFLKALI